MHKTNNKRQSLGLEIGYNKMTLVVASMHESPTKRSWLISEKK